MSTRSENLWRALYDDNRDALMLVEASTGRVVEGNAAAGAVAGKSLDSLLPQCEPAELLQPFLQPRLRPQPARYTHVVLEAREGLAQVQLKLVEREPRVLLLLQVRFVDEALHQGAARYRDLVESSDDLLWSVDLQGCWTSLNAKATRAIYGYEPEEMLGRSFLDFLAEREKARGWETFQDILQGNNCFRYEITHLRKDGTPVDLSFNAVLARDISGKVIGSTGTATDVTSRKKLERALVEGHQRFHVFLDKLPHLAFVKDYDGRLIYINRVFADKFSTQLANHLGKLDHELYPAEIADRLRANDLAVFAAGKSVELRELVPTPDGRLREWLVVKFPYHDANGQVFLGGMAIDLTERFEAEEALRASEAKYRTLIENLDQPVISHSRTLQITAANPTFCALLGKQESELVGRTDDEVLPPDCVEFFRRTAHAVLQSGVSQTETLTLTLGAAPRTWRVTRSPLKTSGGEVVGVLALCADMTEQLALEAQLRHVQKMEAVGQLAGGIAHDFNNLLTVILGNLGEALSDGADPSGTREKLQNAENAGKRAAELTRSLLGFARKSNLQSTPVYLNLVLDEVLRLLRVGVTPAIEIKIRSDDQLPPVLADDGQITQVLLNLTLNARDAMPEGGTLSFDLATFTPDDDYLRRQVEARPGRFVRLRIQDTGTGMTPELRQRIFEPFFTTKGPNKGTGLGLAIVFGIVKQHGGWIDCISAPGRGTTFEVFLPVAEKAHGKPPGPARQDRAKGAETILVADDEPLIRQLMRNILTRAGYTVVLAENGDKVLELCRQRGDDFDLIVLDGVMPQRSGLETLEELNRWMPDIPVLLCSGFANDQPAAARYPQLRGLLQKPYRIEELPLTVRRILDEHPRGRGPG